ncbi:MAG: hypothetical protein NWF07_15845 [Candidatus Bathyarchaeota archaeon]|nr:hypothetical protein [Candidatus Bathyarchaeota archaeon]
MKTYIKLEAKDKEPALKVLRKLAIDMPKVCVMDAGLADSLGIDMAQGSGPGGVSGAGGGGSLDSIEMIMSYFGGPGDISRERCETIVSTSEKDLGEYDFVYEWMDKPEKAMLDKLAVDIAKVLKPTGAKHTLHNK